MHLRLLIILQFIIIASIVETRKTDDIYFPVENSTESKIYLNKYRPLQTYQVSLNPNDKVVNEFITTGITRLTLSLNRLLTNANGGNVIFSPFSISNVLALALLGANGITLQQLSDILGIYNLNGNYQIVHEQFSNIIDQIRATSGQDINVATAVFVQSDYPIRSLYKSTAQDLYDSNILNVDFKNGAQSAQMQVNHWVEKNTRGKIKTILDGLPSSYTKIILASALYFKAEWMSPFAGELTMSRPFYVNGVNSPSHHNVIMMFNMGFFPYYRDLTLGCEIIGLSYLDNKSTMYVIVPFQSSKEKLFQFGSKLTEQDLENLVRKTELTDAVITFPKMVVESSWDLRTPLEILGLRSLFNPQQANLALISPGEFSQTKLSPPSRLIQPRISPVTDRYTYADILTGRHLVTRTGTPETLDDMRDQLNQQSTDSQNPGLYVDQVLHKVFMNITETGTEAASVTSLVVDKIAGGRLTLKVDVPFIFFIRHEKTKTILFWGSIVLPTPNNK